MGSQRKPVSFQVPMGCNMKILKSILWFQLKKVLTVNECSNILGFEASPKNYKIDFMLEKGIGQLNANLNLSLFLKTAQQPNPSLLDYKICRLIAEGGFSKVYLLRNNQTG